MIKFQQCSCDCPSVIQGTIKTSFYIQFFFYPYYFCHTLSCIFWKKYFLVRFFSSSTYQPLFCVVQYYIYNLAKCYNCSLLTMNRCDSVFPILPSRVTTTYTGGLMPVGSTRCAHLLSSTRPGASRCHAHTQSCCMLTATSWPNFTPNYTHTRPNCTHAHTHTT